MELVGRSEKQMFSYEREKRGEMFKGWRERLIEERIG